MYFFLKKVIIVLKKKPHNTWSYVVYIEVQSVSLHQAV